MLPDSSQYPFARHTDLPNLGTSTLVVVDLQRAFTDPGQPTFIRDAPHAMGQALTLVRAFRAANLPIVFTRHAHIEKPVGHGMATWWSRFIMEGSEASKLASSLAPAPGELVLRKHHYSAFHETSLEPWLRNRGVDTIVLSGTMTHICVDCSARDAFMRGFDVVISTDACASKDELLHESTLHGLSHAVARLATTDAIVAVLDEQR